MATAIGRNFKSLLKYKWQALALAGIAAAYWLNREKINSSVTDAVQAVKDWASGDGKAQVDDIISGKAASSWMNQGASSMGGSSSFQNFVEQIRPSVLGR